MDKNNLLKKIAKISKVTGFTRLCYLLNRNRKKIIAYHSIIPDKYFDNSLHLDHSMKESSFKAQLELMKEKFKISTELYKAKELTITFDDGYYNQYEIAARIMDKHGIKGYFFCVQAMLKNGEPILMDKLQYWISYAKEGTYYLEDLKIQLFLQDMESRRKEWEKISNLLLKGVPQEKVEEAFNKAYSFDEIKINKKLYSLRFKPLTRSSIKIMELAGHKIGAHSAYHRRLSFMNEEELKKDISLCKSAFGSFYNTSVFAYPYGSYEDISQRIIELLKEENFTEALSYSSSPLKGAFNYNKFFIPRIYLPDTADSASIEFILSGAKHLITYRKLLPKWNEVIKYEGTKHS